MLTGEYLVSRDMVAGLGRLRRIKLDALSNPVSEPEIIELPFEGNIAEWAKGQDGREIFLLMTSWIKSPCLLRYDLVTGIVEDTGIQPPSSLDFSEIESYELFAPSYDGTMIPITMVHRKQLPLDGTSPTLLIGYGSYEFVLPSRYTPTLLAWYERGGVLAASHIRGGGEHGKDWHLAGSKLNKHNTIADFIACGEYLVERGYTSPSFLAAEGTSAGGIPAGGALTERPDLWAAVVLRVPITNSLRFEFAENGPPNIDEFGSVTTEDGLKGLIITDSYMKVRDDVKYPAVLITTGLNDPRVAPWQATKMVARLQAATSTSSHSQEVKPPILLRVETNGGHGKGATRKQLEEELADKLAFLLQQFYAKTRQSII